MKTIVLALFVCSVPAFAAATQDDPAGVEHATINRNGRLGERLEGDS